MAADPSIVKQAREWIDRVDAGRGLSNSWRLQIIQKRYRKRDVSSDTGTALECDGESCIGLPMRIRRFVPGCPWALVDQAIRYLVCKAPYEGLIYNGLEIPGRYRPTLTMWQRDEQSSVDEQRPQNGTYTLIQDLIEEGCEDEETVVTGESCSYVETTEYHWDDSAPGELPGCGSECDGSGVCQGVTYAIRSNRNEDGSFDWQLVKRVAKTQHAGPFDFECNGCTGKVTRETWDNLYGNAKDGFRDDCGNPVILPGCDDIPGIRTQVQVQQNADCTFKVEITRRESLEYSDSWRDGTSCQVRTVTEDRNLRMRPEDPTPKVGETIRIQLKRNEDCTYDRTVDVTEAPEEYSYGWRDGSRCRTREVTVLRNLRARPSVPEAGPGETLEASVTRNQDCTWDAQYSVRKPYEGDDVTWDDGPECKRRHHTLWIDKAEKPVVSEGAAGETVQASISFDPGSCTWSGQQTVTDAFATGASLEWTDGSSCQKRHHVLYIDSTEKPDVTVGEGQTVQASLSFNDQNCTWNGQVTRTDPMSSDTVVTVGGTCRSAETTETVLNSLNKPDLRFSPAPGETVQARVSRNSDCTWDSTVVTRRSEMGTASWEDGTCMNRSVTYVYSDAPEGTIRAAAASMSKGENDTVSIRITPNQDCTESGSVTVVTNEEKTETRTWTSGGYDVEYTSYRNRKVPKIVNAYNCMDSAENSFSINDNCLYNGHSVKKTRRDCGGGSGYSYLYGPYAKEIDYDEGRRVKGNGAKQKVYAARKKYIVHGSQLYKDIGDFLMKKIAAGFTVSGFRTIGSYSRDSAVFMAVLTGSAFDAKEPAEKRNKESDSTTGN